MNTIGGFLMNFPGFTEEDFNVFKIDGLDARMDQLIKHIRPKLDYLGNYFAPTLSALTGDEMFPHVAKHARRTINPPNDTWVAFANNKRGYKMLPHFQIGLWETHLFVWFALIYEAPNKIEYGKTLEKNITNIRKSIPPHFVWSADHTKPEAMIMGDLSDEELLALFHRLQTVKKAEILCGLHIPRNEAITMDGEEIISRLNDTFQYLIPLYKMS
jgi:uncharacterized protein YktB (UPF0637 family)